MKAKTPAFVLIAAFAISGAAFAQNPIPPDATHATSKIPVEMRDDGGGSGRLLSRDEISAALTSVGRATVKKEKDADLDFGIYCSTGIQQTTQTAFGSQTSYTARPECSLTVNRKGGRVFAVPGKLLYSVQADYGYASARTLLQEFVEALKSAASK